MTLRLNPIKLLSAHISLSIVIQNAAVSNHNIPSAQGRNAELFVLIRVV